jgi:hypothetical protein
MQPQALFTLQSSRMHITFTPPNFENPIRGIRGNFIHVSEGQGQVKDMSTQLAPISYASSIVEFVSFSLTVFICKYQQTSYFGTLGHQHILFIQTSSFATIRNLSRFLELLLQNHTKLSMLTHFLTQGSTHSGTAS